MSCLIPFIVEEQAASAGGCWDYGSAIQKWQSIDGALKY
jgi:hypothetical protein